MVAGREDEPDVAAGFGLREATIGDPADVAVGAPGTEATVDVVERLEEPIESRLGAGRSRDIADVHADDGAHQALNSDDAVGHGSDARLVEGCLE